MIGIPLSALIGSLTADKCEVCHVQPDNFYVTLTFKPGTAVNHGPNCECDGKPLSAHMCAGCKDRAVKCAAGQCDEGASCDVESVKVQTWEEAALDRIAEIAAKEGTTSEAIRLGIAHSLSPRDAETIIAALEAYGAPVDFSGIRPKFTSRVRSQSHGSGGNDTSGSDEPAGGMAPESGKHPEDGGSHQQAAWPAPLIALPNDGNVH